MWNDMPQLMDSTGMIPPPPGAVMGGQPDIHGAFPGHQQRQQAPANWFGGAAAGQGTPWAHVGGGASWANTPASGWANTPGASWANTPGQSPWPQQQQQQQQQQQPSWLPQMPRQGWGPAPQGMASASPWGGERTPWDRFEPPPQSAPASLSHGFNATAAPPESASAQPIMSTSWFGPGAAAGGMQRMHQGGMHRGMPEEELEEGEEFFDYDAEEALVAREEEEAVERWTRQQWARQAQAQGHDPRAGWPQDPRAQGHDPRAGWPQDPRAGWPQDPRAGWPQEQRPSWAQDDLALARVHSFGEASPKKKKKRANSLGRGQLQGWGGTGHAFDENHLSQRPDDWRDGYSPRTGLGADLSFSSFFRVGKKADTGGTGEFADTKKRDLCRVLTFNPSAPRIAYDMRKAPEETSFFGAFRPQHAREMAQPAVTPAATRMRLVHPRLPWYVDVRRQQGITLYDVLRALYDELNLQIAGRDFWNEELGKRDRDGLTRAFKERCQMDGKEHAREEMLKGVKRVDFLGAEVVFVGLARRNGMWEIKTMNDH
ncbi:hypothetical protein FB451DRAFT_152172 [Mycena latifolia]|nr:hypothetical protein FB451DRAFT_152172 [Mycena latifolia]